MDQSHIHCYNLRSHPLNYVSGKPVKKSTKKVDKKVNYYVGNINAADNFEENHHEDECKTIKTSSET